VAARSYATGSSAVEYIKHWLKSSLTLLIQTIQAVMPAAAAAGSPAAHTADSCAAAGSSAVEYKIFWISSTTALTCIPQVCQYVYFCTRKASKLSTSVFSFVWHEISMSRSFPK
jgi:hypothetical protein